MSSLGHGKISDDALQQLNDLLIEHQGFSLEALDGYFSALVVGPESVMPSEYLEGIWPAGSPEWKSVQEFEQAFTLLMSFWNHVVWRVSRVVPDELTDEDEFSSFLPIMLEPADVEGVEVSIEEEMAGMADFPLGAGWVFGFFSGMELRATSWDAWLAKHEDFAQFVDELHELLEGVQDLDQYDGEDGLEPAVTAVTSELEPALAKADIASRKIEIVSGIPYVLEQMYLQRFEDARPQPVRAQAQPGRNDPCPCGSGKKFKKCCAEGQTLH